METNILDMYELYYITDIHSRRHSGVRLSQAYKEQRKFEAFLDRMQIIVLKVLLKRKARK